MKIMKSKGPITEPWGTPVSTFLNLEYEIFIITYCFLLVRKHSIHFNILPVIPISFIFIKSFICETLSNAF